MFFLLCSQCVSLGEGSLSLFIFSLWQGIHLDPSIYLVDDDNKSPSGVHSENKEINPAFMTLDDNATAQIKDSHVSSSDESNGGSRILSSDEGVSADQVDAVSNSMASIGLAESIPEHKGCSLLFAIFKCWLVSY